MKRLAAPVCLLLFAAGSLFAQERFAFYFTGGTLRVDLFHTGTKGEERFTLSRSLEEGAWPGHCVNLVDTLNLGEYLLCVADRSTNVLIYSRGFSSLFNEWQTTDEALSGVYRTFSESVRFPFPRRAVRLAIARRDRKMEFHEVYSAVIDPADPVQVMKERPWTLFPVSAVVENGPPSVKVDIAVMGDGYAAGDMEKYRADVGRFVETMFRTHPFRERKKDFNVWRIDVVSGESGIDIPDKNVWKRNALGTKYNTFGSPRYVLTEENAAVRDIASAAPYDFLCILVNDSRYGGGGNIQPVCDDLCERNSSGGRVADGLRLCPRIRTFVRRACGRILHFVHGV